MIKVTCEVPTYDPVVKPSIKVHSHWDDPRVVVIDFGDDQRMVKAKELHAAIDNAVNTKRL